MWSSEPQLRQVRFSTLGHCSGSVLLWQCCGSPGTYILGEVAGLVALATLDTLSRARLCAVGGLVSLLLAVLAGERVDALLWAIAGAVTSLMAVHTFDAGLDRLVLGHLLLTVLSNMSVAMFEKWSK